MSKFTNEDGELYLECAEDYTINEIEMAMTFLTTLKPIKTMNRRISSYGLKHIAEGNRYISNESLIIAGYLLGFTMEWTDKGSPNVYLNISKKSIKEWGQKIGVLC